MSKPWLVFCDMDGVIADFVSAAIEYHGLPDPYTRPENLGTFEIEQLWGITERAFWGPLGGKDFWHDLKKTPEADEIIDLLTARVGVENICIATAPSESVWSIPGKKAWIKRNYPQFSRSILFGGSKHFLAGDKKVLVDDRDKNLIAFNREGGTSVVVPRAWNRAYLERETVMESIKAQLDQYEVRN